MSSRRDFLKSSLVGIGGIGVLSTLASCSTFDEFIFDDRHFSDDQVVIVGGGISGLSLAYKLRQLKMDYRIFEGSSYLGGRIKSSDGLDFGASLFEQSDVLLKKLIKEFNLPTVPISATQFYMAGGAEQLVSGLKARVTGLMPYRNARLRWKLIEIAKVSDGFDLLFDTPDGRKTMRAKKVALTLPPSQWARVSGLLDLPEMSWGAAWLKTLKPEVITKLNYLLPPNMAFTVNKKAKVFLGSPANKISVLAKTLKNNMTGLEIEVYGSQNLDPESLLVHTEVGLNLEQLITEINDKTKLSLSAKRASVDAIYNWADVDLIQSAYFKNPTSISEFMKNDGQRLQVFGDYSAAEKPHTVEGALSEAERVSALFV